MQKWKYLAVVTPSAPSPDELNQYGKDGWELVTVVTGTIPLGVGYIAYFKRLKS